MGDLVSDSVDELVGSIIWQFCIAVLYTRYIRAAGVLYRQQAIFGRRLFM